LMFILLLCLVPCNLIMRTQNIAFAAEAEDAEDAVVEEVEEDEDEEDEVVATGDDEGEEEEEEASGDIGASSDVDVKIIFPEHSDLSFPAGSIVTALIGFHNKGQNAFTVQNIEASLRHLQDFSFHIQNFTNEAVNQEIKSHEHATFLYKFKPHESFDPRDFGFVLNVHYIDNNEAPYRHTALNSTVHIVDSEESFDTRSFIAYVSTLAIGVLGVLVYKQKSTKPAAAANKKKEAVETGTSKKTEVDNDWLASANLPAGFRAKGAKKASQ